MIPAAKCTIVFLGTGQHDELTAEAQQVIDGARLLVTWIALPQALTTRSVEQLEPPSRAAWASPLQALLNGGDFTYLAPGFSPDDDLGARIATEVLADATVEIRALSSGRPGRPGPVIVGPADKQWQPDPGLTAIVRGICNRTDFDRWRDALAQEFGPEVELLVREWTSFSWQLATGMPSTYPVALRADPTDLSKQRSTAGLREIFRILRGPDGCPWDRTQTHVSLRRYILEEASEVIGAIDSGDPNALAEELGDVLANVVLHTEIARQTQTFIWPDVVQGVIEKMVRRHPHVFGDEVVADPTQVAAIWSREKLAEGHRPTATTIDGTLPALAQAAKLADVLGFNPTGTDLPDITKSEMARTSASKLAANSALLGDALLGLALAAKRSCIDPEMALRDAVRRVSSQIDS